MPRKDDVAAMRSQVEGMVWCANWSQNDVSLIIPLDHLGYFGGMAILRHLIITSYHLKNHLFCVSVVLETFCSVRPGEEITSKVRSRTLAVAVGGGRWGDFHELQICVFLLWFSKGQVS